jgi:hypothetical protein
MQGNFCFVFCTQGSTLSAHWFIHYLIVYVDIASKIHDCVVVIIIIVYIYLHIYDFIEVILNVQTRAIFYPHCWLIRVYFTVFCGSRDHYFSSD